MRAKRSLTLVELLTNVALITVLLGVFALYALPVLKAGRERALENELMNLRMSVEHYRLIYGKFPESLEELVNKTLTEDYPYAKIGFYRFFEAGRLDSQGFLSDPFWHRYAYDKQTGRVYSQTPGYQTW